MGPERPELWSSGLNVKQPLGTCYFGSSELLVQVYYNSETNTARTYEHIDESVNYKQCTRTRGTLESTEDSGAEVTDSRPAFGGT